MFGFARNFEDSRERDDGFTAAWQRGQAPSQTNQPAATRGAYRGSDDPLRSEPLSQRRAPPLAPSNVYTGCPAPADTLLSCAARVIRTREQLFVTLLKIYLSPKRWKMFLMHTLSQRRKYALKTPESCDNTNDLLWFFFSWSFFVNVDKFFNPDLTYFLLFFRIFLEVGKDKK